MDWRDNCLTIDEVVKALMEIREEFGGDIPVAMLPDENNEPYAVTGVNCGYDEEGKPVANFTTDD